MIRAGNPGGLIAALTGCLAAISLIVAACTTVPDLTAPGVVTGASTLAAEGGGAGLSQGNGANTLAVCHMRGNGDVELLFVNPNASDAHMGHGDALAFEVFSDADGDGFGTGAGTAACSIPPGFADNADDCNDGDASINPGAVEVCDGADNNCDGNADEGGVCVIAECPCFSLADLDFPITEFMDDISCHEFNSAAVFIHLHEAGPGFVRAWQLAQAADTAGETTTGRCSTPKLTFDGPGGIFLFDIGLEEAAACRELLFEKARELSSHPLFRNVSCPLD